MLVEQACAVLGIMTPASRNILLRVEMELVLGPARPAVTGNSYWWMGRISRFQRAAQNSWAPAPAGRPHDGGAGTLPPPQRPARPHRTGTSYAGGGLRRESAGGGRTERPLSLVSGLPDVGLRKSTLHFAPVSLLPPHRASPQSKLDTSAQQPLGADVPQAEPAGGRLRSSAHDAAPSSGRGH